MMELIKVGNGTNKYPGNFTKKKLKIIKENLTGMTLHLFSGKSEIGETRVDYVHGNVKMDVFYYLENSTALHLFKTVIIDAPYNKRFAEKYQKLGNTSKQFIIFANVPQTRQLFNLLEEKVKPEIIILKSWNYYVPANYQLKKLFLCYAGGYRKLTVLEILERKEI